MPKLLDIIKNIFSRSSDKPPEQESDIDVEVFVAGTGYVPVSEVMEKMEKSDDSDAETELDVPKKLTKSELKKQLKDKYRKKKNLKFCRREKYVIKNNLKVANLPYDKHIYECRQIIWCMEDFPLCGVVMKQIYGNNYSCAFLNKEDCNLLHVKYEPGLQLMSMYLDWRKYTGDVNALRNKRL